MLMKIELNADCQGFREQFNGTPIIISNDKNELIQELTAQISQFEVGDMLSVSLVNEPDEKDLDAIAEHNDYELAASSSWNCDD
jgi:hypothetical protein